MDRCYETYFVQYLFWLLAQRQEQFIREIEKDLGHGFCLSGRCARSRDTLAFVRVYGRERDAGSEEFLGQHIAHMVIDNDIYCHIASCAVRHCCNRVTFLPGSTH